MKASPKTPLLRTGFHTFIRTDSQKRLLEDRARRAAEHLKRAKSGALHAARFATSVERTIIVAPLSFSHEIAAAMREGRGVRFALRLCKRFVLFYLPWFGIASMAFMIGTVNIFTSAKTGAPTLFRAAYAATLEESGAPQIETKANLANDNVYAGESTYVSSPSILDVGGPVPAVPANESLESSAVYATPSPVPPNVFSTGTPAASANSRGVITYTVKEGDVPSIIASSFDISLDTLLWANDLKDGDYIRPGDKLIILPVSGVQYKVQKGDTLAGIASRFKGDADQIISFNNISSADGLKQGQILIIPSGQMPIVERKSQSLYTPAYADTSSLKDVNGYFIAPTSGYISQGLHPHDAVDIADACGTPVYAAAAGRVLIADGTGWNGGYGKYVLIQHPNGAETRYAHAERLVVSSGEVIAQGQLIMYIGETGHATGCHVHFEVLGARNPFARTRVGTTL